MTDPAPMTRADLDRHRARLAAHDHAVCVYETRDQLERALAAFLDEGLARRELCVYVHSERTDDEAWSTILRARPDASDHRGKGIVLVRVYREAFEGGRGKIDHDHAAGVVATVVATARERDLRGSRVFVDASRVYLEAGRADEWFAFEAVLGRRLAADVGLICAYPRRHAMRDDVLPRVLATHAYRFDAPSADAAGS